ncbi:hypothetical protein A3J78_00270 [Candidatus Beckwithbacteria bacterium RBG_13_35_6]|uniref:Uncharacterized protein n=1 Tax=Candidatus Beckwithbacteria bacterium RBG_13_35_6 TaxID=1797456 RepID=A0A1F5DBW9_9BACT|nr:MAG: hypothetical protein A3J78_00270 [Candidatus Beckwithbacteria bacterium RBG_13_35_6]
MKTDKKELLTTTITIAIIVIICGIFWWFVASKFLFLQDKSISKATPAPSTQEENITYDKNSDEIPAVESDLKSLDLNDVDKELTDIEAELAQP